MIRLNCEASSFDVKEEIAGRSKLVRDVVQDCKVREVSLPIDGGVVDFAMKFNDISFLLKVLEAELFMGIDGSPICKRISEMVNKCDRDTIREVIKGLTEDSLRLLCKHLRHFCTYEYYLQERRDWNYHFLRVNNVMIGVYDYVEVSRCKNFLVVVDGNENKVVVYNLNDNTIVKSIYVNGYISDLAIYGDIVVYITQKRTLWKFSIADSVATKIDEVAENSVKLVNDGVHFLKINEDNLIEVREYKDMKLVYTIEIDTAEWGGPGEIVINSFIFNCSLDVNIDRGRSYYRYNNGKWIDARAIQLFNEGYYTYSNTYEDYDKCIITLSDGKVCEIKIDKKITTIAISHEREFAIVLSGQMLYIYDLEDGGKMKELYIGKNLYDIRLLKDDGVLVFGGKILRLSVGI